jgi:hypothetical protein
VKGWLCTSDFAHRVAVENMSWSVGTLASLLVNSKAGHSTSDGQMGSSATPFFGSILAKVGSRGFDRLPPNRFRLAGSLLLFFSSRRRVETYATQHQIYRSSRPMSMWFRR